MAALSGPVSAGAAARGYSLVVVIPVFDHEHAIGGVLDALEPSGLPVILVDDGSSQACKLELERQAQLRKANVSLIRLPVNQGKGGAVIAGCRAAHERGYTHALQIDADGQHDLGDLPRFRAESTNNPEAVICGAPRFDQSIPRGRKYGRLLTSVWVWINSLSLAIEDVMCGYRIYPLPAVVRVFDRARGLGLRMDFDPEVLVRLCWDGLQMVNVPTKVRYPADGRSHFRMLRDNWLISLMHTRLFFGMLPRAPWLLARKLRGRQEPLLSGP